MMFLRLLSGIFLVAGTTIGAVTIVLPAMIAAMGMVVGSALFVVIWLLMFISGLYVIEALSCFNEPVSYVSMASEFFGPMSKPPIWLFFLLLFYSLMAAYLTGGAEILSHFKLFENWSVHELSALWVCIGILGLISGESICHVVNRGVMILLLLSFVGLIGLILGYAKLSWQTHVDAGLLSRNTMVVLTAFGYQIVLPSLKQHVGADTDIQIRSILWGTLLVLVLYVLWSNTLLSTVSDVASLNTLAQSVSPAETLAQSVGSFVNPQVVLVFAEVIFATALLSSFIGVSLALFHFLSDGMHAAGSPFRRALAALLTMCVPWIFSYVYPNGFLHALEYGAVFVILLNMILPCAMSLQRRRLQLPAGYVVPGGYWPMLLILAFVCWLLISRFIRVLG